MIHSYYSERFEAMNQYTDADWLPAASQTSMGPVTYCVDDSFLTPQLSCADTNSFPATPATTRPRSSTSGFVAETEAITRRRSHSAGYCNPQLDDPAFLSAGLGIKQDGPDDLIIADLGYTQSPAARTTSPSPFYSTVPLPDMPLAPSRLSPVMIAPVAPQMATVASQKRGREDDGAGDMAAKRPRRSSVNTNSSELTEEERLLLRLKDDFNLPWKDIALRFRLDLGKVHQVPALQMRYKRLRERLRVWTDVDVQALQQARDYWEKFKWDIISLKMMDFGCTEKWPAKYCIRKWEELHPDQDLSREVTGSEHGTPELLTPRP